MNEIDAMDRAAKELKDRRFRESMEEAADLSRSMLRSGLHTFNHNGRKIQL